MGRKPTDISREYCTIIDNKNSHVRCNFCGHKMQGITRFKEHLAGKRGDVSPCKCCPEDVKGKVVEALIQLSLKREEKERRRREVLQSRIGNTSPPPPPPSNNKKRPAAATADLEAEERALMEKVMKESIETFEMEKEKAAKYETVMEESLQTFEMEQKKAAKYEDDEIEAAILESMRYYKEEAWRRGEGCSKYARAGPSSFGNNYESIDVHSDYGSDDDFSI